MFYPINFYIFPILTLASINEILSELHSNLAFILLFDNQKLPGLYLARIHIFYSK